MMTLHGIVQNFGGIVAVRFLMGIFEAGLFPAAVTVSQKRTASRLPVLIIELGP
jgi:hypothetical protein